MPEYRSKSPKFIQRRIEQHYLNVSLSRVLPLLALIVCGVLAGLVFDTGIAHPYDKVVHIGFFVLLTLALHPLFCCRLRLTAIVAFSMGLAAEIIQGFLPHHDTSLADAFANGLGVAVVVTMIALLRSEEKQALKVDPVLLDLEEMGLQPMQSDHADSPPLSERSSEK